MDSQSSRNQAGMNVAGLASIRDPEFFDGGCDGIQPCISNEINPNQLATTNDMTRTIRERRE